MNAFTVWMTLGLCSGYVPGDSEMTEYLCDRQWKALTRFVERTDVQSYPDRNDRKRPSMDKEFKD